MVGLSMSAADKRQQPRLVVGIVVEGLQADYLDNLRDYFGEGGFKRLMDDGVVIANADYGTALDPVAATALLMTGASPAVTGIDNKFIYDISGQRLTPVLEDAEFIGNFTNETYSPRKLIVSTLADEVRIAGGGVTNVFAIAPDPQQAIILGGHAANSVVWLNEANGNWATSTFYKDLPAFVGGKNRLAPLSNRLDTMSWTPLMPVTDYPDLPDHLKHYPFRYVFPHGNADRYTLFKNSAPANAEVTSLATEFIKNLSLGKHDGVDMLNLTYSLAPFEDTKNPDNRLETMDSYLRLDRNLEQLFAAIDNTAGKGNSVVFLAATPPPTSVRRDDEKWDIPYGQFSTRKAGSLLNMYLMAVYGTGEWVSGFHNGHFYLNTKLIKEKNLDPKAVRTEAASFVARMSGVKDVFTIDRILDGDAGEHSHALKRNTNVATAGDLFVTVTPGWEIVNDYLLNSNVKSGHVERFAATTAPVFIMAPDVNHAKIDFPVDARVIAPTVARLLRIRSPNAASLPAIQLNK